MPDDGSVALPQNIQEFNQIIVVVFSQLYVAHPMEKTLDPAEIAEVIGVSPTGTLPSGRRFADVFVMTVRWLNDQGFIRANGEDAHERATLTARALVAMNAAPPALVPKGITPPLPTEPTANTGTTLVRATTAVSQGNRTQLVELAGSFIGSVIKATLGS
jgi:hypothetical protein